MTTGQDRPRFPIGREHRRVVAACTVVGGAIVVHGQRVGAETFTVSNTDAAGEGSLAEAIFDANTTPGPDTIVFTGAGASGTIDLGGGFATINDDVTIIGPGAAQLTLTSSSGFFYIYNEADFTLSGVTIADVGTSAVNAQDAGNISVTDVVIDTPSFSGVYVVNDSGEMTDDVTLTRVEISDSGTDAINIEDVRDVTLTDVTVTNSGGDGIDVADVDDLTISSSTITGSDVRGIGVNRLRENALIEDTEVDDSGTTGITLGRSASPTGPSVVRRTTVTRSDGHGLWFNAGDVRIEDVRVEQSLVDGIRASQPHEFTIDDVEVENSGYEGVHVYSFQPTVPTVTITELDVNQSGQNGVRLYDVDDVLLDTVTVSDSSRAGIRLLEADDDVSIRGVLVSESGEQGIDLTDVIGSVLIDRSTVTDSGAHAVELDDVSVDATIRTSTLAENDGTATSVVSASQADLDVEHSTIASNDPAGATGAIEADGTSDVSLDHTIVTGNDGLPAVVGGSNVSAEFSLLPPGAALGPTNTEAADPDLGPLQDNGGTTPTLLPAVSSPAVNAGDPSISNPPDTDQRGFSRILDTIDIGAVELLGAAITPVDPQRFVDTRPGESTIDGAFAGGGKRAAMSEYEVEIAGRGDVPADAVGVVINVTAVAPEAIGFVTAHPCVSPRPVASSLNYTPGVNLGNEIVSGLSEDGTVCLYTDSRAHLTVDVVGYLDPLSPAIPLTPARLLDSRPGTQTIDGKDSGVGRSGPQSTRTLKVAGRGGVPADAVAAILNVTAVAATDVGFVTVHPCVNPRPTASSLNYVAAVNRGNELLASLNEDGEVCLYTETSIHMTVDVVGYVLPGSNLRPIEPARFLDTRPGQSTIDGLSEGEGKRSAGSTYALTIGDRAGVPAGAKAAVVNITAVAPEAVGFVTASPCVDPRPTASSLNYVPGVNGGNEIVARLSAGGQLCLYTSAAAHLTVDVVAYLD